MEIYLLRRRALHSEDNFLKMTIPWLQLRENSVFYFYVSSCFVTLVLIPSCNGFRISVRPVLHWKKTTRPYEMGSNTFKNPSFAIQQNRCWLARRRAQSFGLSCFSFWRILQNVNFRPTKSLLSRSWSFNIPR